MRDLLGELESEADYVILDSPPILAVSDSSLLASSASGVLLVMRANSTSVEAAKRALEQLEGAQAKVIGTVLNDVQSGREGYYYYYYYHQYYTSSEESQDSSGPGGPSGPSATSRPRKNAKPASVASKIQLLLLSVMPKRG